MQPATQRDVLARDRLGAQLLLGLGHDGGERGCEFAAVERFPQRLLERALAQRAHLGEAHAVGREHPGERMQQHARHAERGGHRAGMLAASATEADQGVVAHVVAALHRDGLDRIGHVLDRDAQEALGDLLRAGALAGRGGNLIGQGAETGADRILIERLILCRPEHRREEVRL